METKDPSADITNVRKLEDIRFSQFVTDSLKKRESDLGTLKNSLAARGLLNSGGYYKGVVDIIFNSIESIIDKAIANRKELGSRVPTLLTAPDLTAFQDKLDRHINAGVSGYSQRLTLKPGNPIGRALLPEAERKAYALRAKVKRELAALPLEAALGMHQGEAMAQMTTLHISNSTIATLNLGTVVGDLNSSIQSLTGAGQTELAESISKLTDAIAASNELADATRKELLEHLAFVSGEVALPVEKRKIGPLKSSILMLKTGLSVVTQLTALWQAVEQILKATGHLPQ